MLLEQFADFFINRLRDFGRTLQSRASTILNLALRPFSFSVASSTH
ncbi:MAG: hypothetical protein IPJ07_23540 [Acidobacteria bacterium]|nr:hypothetical protein [Acidobacteriota bacterium]